MAMLPRVHPHSTTRLVPVLPSAAITSLFLARASQKLTLCAPPSLLIITVGSVGLQLVPDMDCFFVVYMSRIVIVFTWSMDSWSQSFD
jgi:hypothetical protein